MTWVHIFYYGLRASRLALCPLLRPCWSLLDITHLAFCPAIYLSDSLPAWLSTYSAVYLSDWLSLWIGWLLPLPVLPKTEHLIYEKYSKYYCKKFQIRVKFRRSLRNPSRIPIKARQPLEDFIEILKISLKFQRKTEFWNILLIGKCNMSRTFEGFYFKLS